VYICDVDQGATEGELAAVFADCGGAVRDLRVCGDPNSALRFAFIEFADEGSAWSALAKNGTVLGSHPLRVLPSRTAIVPVNGTLLPRSRQEQELVARTVYAANIDKQVERAEVSGFFEALCGPVARLRLLGDAQHATRIAFVEFASLESALAALNCSGAFLGALPVRISPSKTPVRSDQRQEVGPGRASRPGPGPRRGAEKPAQAALRRRAAAAGAAASPGGVERLSAAERSPAPVPAA